MSKRKLSACCLVAAAVLCGPLVHGGAISDSLKAGDVELESIGTLAFGPEGILLIADPLGSAVYALATGKEGGEKAGALPTIEAIDGKLAAMYGTTNKEIVIQDIAVNPATRNAYISFSRGTGPGAEPVLVEIGQSGTIKEVSFENVRHAKTTLWPAPGPGRRGRDQRGDTITDIAFADDRVIVAGLSNEEFTSRLRSVPFPFTGEHAEIGVQIYHTSHGQWETHSPIRTFVTQYFDSEPYLIAAHVCTPLVKIPLSDIVPGAKVTGTTIAELGAGNRPLDMIAYRKDGEEYLLLSNSRHGVMKIAVRDLPGQEGLTDRIRGAGGAPNQKIADFSGVIQMDKWGDNHALVLQRDTEGLTLKTLALP